MRLSRLLALVLMPAAAACGGARSPATMAKPAPASAGATTAAISPADLEARISIFAADSMEGRRAGSPGNVRGNAYIAAELRRLGLRPAGDEGGYLQRVPLMSYAVDSSQATLRAGSESLVPFVDYYPYQPTFGVPARPINGAQVVYIGTPADSGSLPSREQLKGKVVLFRSSGDGNTLAALDLSPQGRFGLIAGLASTDMDPLLAKYADYLSGPKVDLKETGDSPAALTQPRILLVPTATVAKLFGRPLDQLRPGEPGPVLQGEVAYEGTELRATNVVAILEGSDPALRGEYVALGAHNDAIGIVAPVDHDSIRAYNAVIRPRGANDTPREPSAEEASRIKTILDSLRRQEPARPDSIVNGADDDGSGSMGLLEIAERLVRSDSRPKRSLLFVWHTGEETGLHGSRWFTDHPTVPRDSIVAQINIDMIGRGDPGDVRAGGPAYLEVLGARRLSSELGDLVEKVNTEGKFGFAFNYAFDANGHPDQYYCRSDHANYARYGIPIVFFSTGSHRDYHQVTDEAAYLDYDKYATVVRYVDALTSKVANLDHRMVVDKPRPDPKAPCVQ